MLMKMDPQRVVEVRLRARYERLISDDIKKVSVLPGRRRIMNKINGRTLKRKGIRLPRARKLNWKAIFGAIIWPKRIAKIYADIVSRMKMDGVYPGIGFSCQWGFPVISHHHHHHHQTLKCRNNSDVYFHGKRPSMGSIIFAR